MSEWIEVSKQLPPDGVTVMTKIDDQLGCRNETPLRPQGRLWFFPDMSMYVYYNPTHWKPIKETAPTVPPERTYSASDLRLAREKALLDVAHCLRDGKVEFSHDPGEPDVSPLFPVRYVLPMESWKRLQDVVFPDDADQPALDQNDAEYDAKLLNQVIGAAFPATPGGYLTRTQANAESAELKAQCAAVMEKVQAAIEGVSSTVEFYLKREIESPSNHQEFAREAQGKLTKFRAACYFTIPSDWSAVLAEHDDLIRKHFQKSIDFESLVAERVRDAVREELEKVQKVFRDHDGIPNLSRYLEQRLAAHRAAAGALPAFLDSEWGGENGPAGAPIPKDVQGKPEERSREIF